MFCDPYLNHFTQPDTIVPDAYNSQDYDRYAYARNNPVKYTDPSGHTAENDRDGGVGGGCDLECWRAQFKDTLSEAIFYNPILGGSSSGCNTYILHNTDGDFCHHTTYESKQICYEIFDCSPEKQMDYASRFQYPVQMPWNPVVGPDDRSVMGGDFIPDLYDIGAVYVRVDGQVIINYTYDTHFFHEGNITRTIHNINCTYNI